MKRVIKIISFLAFALIVQNTWAQLNTNRLIPSPEKISAPIYDVQPDRMGDIWLATQAGLMRYDGYELKRFYPDLKDSLTIGKSLTYRLFEDEDGTIWIGCIDYVSAYNPRTHSFKNYNFTDLTDFPPYSQPIIWKIASDNKGRVYFGVTSLLGMSAAHALIYFDKKEEQLKRFEYPKSDSISNVAGLAVDKDNNVWVSSRSGLFTIDSLHKLHHIRSPFKEPIGPNNWISAIHYDPSGKILMASNKFRMYAYDPEHDTYSSWHIPKISKKAKENLSVYDMLTDSLGNTWIGSNHGLFFYNRRKDSFEMFWDHPIMKDDVYGLRFDSFGDLWIATKSMGLMRYTDRTLLKSFIYKQDDHRSITKGWAKKIFANPNGSVWIGTDGDILSAGLNLLDPVSNSITPYPYHTFLPGMEYYNLIGMNSPGDFLIGTNTGYFECNPVTRKCTPVKLQGIPQDVFIYMMRHDSHRNTIYCTTNGLYLENPNGKFRHYDLTTLPGGDSGSNEVTNVYENPKQGLWILTNNGLFLYHYDTDQIERIGFDSSKGDVLLSQDINSFYEDSTGIAWIGTWQGGLSRYNPEKGKIKTYTLNDGLPSMAIQGILGDEKNKVLWLSTFNGISRFNMKNETFNNFSLEDGIQGALYADAAYARTKSGTFVFGGNNGITYFNADDVSRKSIPPKVFITDFKVANKSYTSFLNTPYKTEKNKKHELSFSYDQNNISIEYTGIQYDNPSRNQFAYKLENYDDSWRNVKKNRTAYYYNLPPGNYTFQVKAANSNGVWNEKGASVSFMIAPPWWETWWAYGFYGFLFIAGVFTVDRIQRKRLHEKERRLASEKELQHAKEIEKAYTELEISHKNLKATQTQLIQAEKMASLGELTAGIAHEIQNPLNFVNNFSEVSTELLEEMREEIENGNFEEVKVISSDLNQNLEKILTHGRRADGIVKGMLQHSRGSSGQKEPTDINALADEYLRLSYHGLRARDKSFNADFKLEADETLPKVNVVPQDMGRVLLNLINNAFYAVSE
ncbi:MAG TPA: two-component regulator propeller domain-containing protein, partial [Balneolales bacterium]|nr:two-component regulator propeller domain-containing protein [Balneolales bacterium]